MRSFVFLAAALLAVASTAQAQCGPNGCRVCVETSHEWRRIDGDSKRWYLFAGQLQLGGYDPELRIYRTYDAATDTWGAPQDSPPAAAPAVPNCKGVDASKLTGSRFEINGQKVSMGDIPDDSSKPRVTVIGSDADRKKVTDAIKSSDLAGKVAVWSVEPSHWSLRDSDGGEPRFKTDGKPTVYVQAPSGKVLHRQDDWQGPEDVGAIRKALKGYDAALDPDLRKNTAIPIPGASPAALLAMLGFFFAFAKYKGVI